MIDLVVFDMAGTTVYDGDSVAACFRSALAAAGVSPDPAAVTAVMGIPKPEAVRTLLTAAGKPSSPADVAPVHADFVRRMLAYYETAPAVREVPGAGDVFRRLRAAGVKVALDTGFSRPIVDAILARLGWDRRAVDATAASDEVPRGRPHPDLIQHLMTRLGVSDPRRVAKAGDTVSDLEQGTAAGCGMVIGVLTGACTREQLGGAPHTHLVDSVTDVPALVLVGGERSPQV